MSDVNNRANAHHLHKYLLSSGMFYVFQFLEDAFRGKLQSSPVLAHGLELIIIFIGGSLDLASLGDLGSDFWSDRYCVFALESLRVLMDERSNQTGIRRLSCSVPPDTSSHPRQSPSESF